MTRFLSFTSGSCGNCYYLEADNGTAILIDAGISIRRMKACLNAVGIDPERIAAVLVTHDHYDHIRNLGSYCKHLSLPVWASERLHEALAHHFSTAPHIAPCRRLLREKAWNEVAPGILARYFVVPHDATETLGYALCLGQHHLVLMTDLGAVPKEAMDFAKAADSVIIESNYDMDMLMGGSYPHELKMRIVQGAGHLSNDDCATAIRQFWHPGLRNLFLCHLSGENNRPRLAYDNARECLRSLGVEDGSLQLRVLPRGEATPLLQLDSPNLSDI